MRNAFIEELTALAAVHDHIALVVGDLGYSVVEPFADLFPDRFMNAGVAEQNLTGLAAGMASEGYHVFTYSIANFPTFRCAEQIRNDIDYHQLPVTIVAVGGGLAYGNLGYSHHAVQDYALMRSLPHMLIAAPGDPMEVRACLRYLVAHPGPSYLRLGKAGEPCFHTAPPAVEPGQWLLVAPSISLAPERRCYLTTGATLGHAMRRQQTPGHEAHSVLSLPLWGMRAKARQAAQVQPWDAITTLEDHLTDGGLGAWLLEALPGGQGQRDKIELRALDAVVCGTVGGQQVLNEMGGLIAT